MILRVRTGQTTTISLAKSLAQKKTQIKKRPKKSKKMKKKESNLRRRTNQTKRRSGALMMNLRTIKIKMMTPMKTSKNKLTVLIKIKIVFKTNHNQTANTN